MALWSFSMVASSTGVVLGANYKVGLLGCLQKGRSSHQGRLEADLCLWMGK